MKKFAVLLSAMTLVGSSSAAWSQGFTGVPGRATPVVVPKIPQPTPQLVTPTATQAPQVVPQVQNFAPIQIPIFNHSTTILPTDTLSSSLHFAPRTTESVNAKGAVRVQEFTELSQFLKEHGWAHNPAEEYDAKFLDENIPAINTDLLESNGHLLPVGYVQGAAPDSEHVAIQIAPSCREVVIFSNPNQFTSIGKDGRKGVLVSGTPGTIVSHNDKGVVLYDGRILVDTGEQPATILTKLAGMKLEPQSTAVVECRNGKVLSIEMLHGAALKYRLASSPDTEHQLPAGDLLTAGGVMEDHADPTAVAAEFLSEHHCHSSELVRLHHHLGIHESHAHDSSAANNVPLTEATHVFGRDGSKVVVSKSGLIGLISGSVLLHTQAPQVVRTQLGDVYLQPHSVIAVERWKGQMRTYCCSEPKSAIVVCEKFGVPLEWGEEVVLTDHTPTLADIVPNDDIGRRRFEAHKLTKNYCALSDFCLDSFLCKAPHTHHLRKPSTKVHEDLRGRLMKTAASLQMVTGLKGRYLLQSEIATQAAAQPPTR